MTESEIELMQYYDEFVRIVKQTALDAEHQILLLRKFDVADEIASDFCDIGVLYAKHLYEKDFLTKEQFSVIHSIEELFESMSHDKTLWTDNALKTASEWEECRNKSKLLLNMLIE